MSYRSTKFGNVFFSDDALQILDERLNNYKSKGSVVFFLVDENTHEQCLVRLLPELPSLGTYEVLEIPSGEESKSAEVALQLWSALAELGADRNSLIINVGGGVVCDLGGFLAGTYMRGISFFHIPTSLLAMVDASLGGKTAVDVGGAKNLAGLFLPSDGVFLIPDFLETLDERNLRSGFAEMLKHGIIADKSHFEALQEVDVNTLHERGDLIRASMNIKMDIVEEDPTEKGIRKALNFGHTLGHAIESYFVQSELPSLLHGEAIAIGMWLETELSVLKKLIFTDEARTIQQAIEKHFTWVELPETDWLKIVDWLKFDKKNVAEVPQFTLLTELGVAVVNQEVQRDQIMETFASWNHLQS